MSATTGSSTPAEVEHDYDPEFWIEVPLAFPSFEMESGEEWALAVARSAINEPGEARDRVAEVARGIVAQPASGADRRLWYFPTSGPGMALVDVFVLPRSPELEQGLGEFLGAVEVPSTDAVESELDPGQAHRLVRVARLAREARTDLSADTAAPAGVYGIIRIGRVDDDSILVLETVNEDLALIASMLDPFDALATRLVVGGEGV